MLTITEEEGGGEVEGEGEEVACGVGGLRLGVNAAAEWLPLPARKSQMYCKTRIISTRAIIACSWVWRCVRPWWCAHRRLVEAVRREGWAASYPS